MRRHNSVVSSFNVYWCLWLGVLECRCEADSYGNEKLIRNGPNPFFVFVVFQSYGNENGPDSYNQIRLSVS